MRFIILLTRTRRTRTLMGFRFVYDTILYYKIITGGYVWRESSLFSTEIHIGRDAAVCDVLCCGYGVLGYTV